LIGVTSVRRASSRFFLLILKGDLVSKKQNNPLPKILGESFRDAREKRGLSIEELADKAILSSKQIRQIEGTERGAFYSSAIKYQSAQKVAKILELPADQAFDPSEVMLDEDMQVLREQKKLNEIEAMLSKKMINEIKFEKPSLIQKIIGKKTSMQLPIQGIEMSHATGSKSVFKRIVFLLILLAVFSMGCWLLNPYIYFY
jgi:transcriptional regulator with XRE-family HTH domain